VLRHLGEALDHVRKSEYARVSGRQRRFIKGQKYILLVARRATAGNERGAELRAGSPRRASVALNQQSVSWTSGSALARDTSLSITRASRTLTLPSVAASPYLPGVDVRRAVVVALVVGILAAPLVAETFSGSCQAIFF
jgi:hypothetical protein